MSAIIKGFPDFYLMDFPVDRWSRYPVEIPGSLASLPSKEDQLLDFVVSRLLKEKDWLHLDKWLEVLHTA